MPFNQHTSDVPEHSTKRLRLQTYFYGPEAEFFEKKLLQSPRSITEEGRRAWRAWGGLESASLPELLAGLEGRIAASMTAGESRAMERMNEIFQAVKHFAHRPCPHCGK